MRVESIYLDHIFPEVLVFFVRSHPDCFWSVRRRTRSAKRRRRSYANTWRKSTRKTSRLAYVVTVVADAACALSLLICIALKLLFWKFWGFPTYRVTREARSSQSFEEGAIIVVDSVGHLLHLLFWAIDWGNVGPLNSSRAPRWSQTPRECHITRTKEWNEPSCTRGRGTSRLRMLKSRRRGSYTAKG